MNSLIEAYDIKRSFSNGGKRIEVLKGVNLKVCKGEIISILGVSGSGKSTLLHILGLMDKPDEGELIFLGLKNPFFFNERDIAVLRNREIGFVFQFPSLLPEFSVLENVLMPTFIAKLKNREKKAKQILRSMDLKESLFNRRSYMLSEGEKQRVVLARALINEPQLIIADEPTASLDEKTAEEIFDLIKTINESYKQTFVVSSHDENLLKKCHHSFYLRGGKLHET
ncbi:MAG: ABC transporter ATP-binding protein [Deltaproteobacteria bacterium]|nr:ABC transporter ATP-binding protein [Deltaproteobacteria bacterium]